MAITEFSSDETVVLGSIFGVRRFGIGSGKIKSLLNEFVWAEGENIALCSRGNHTYCTCGWCRRTLRCAPGSIPGTECFCGLYAYYGTTKQDYVGYSGIVEAYGNIVLGTRGFRAEKMKIRAFFADTDDYILPGQSSILASKNRINVPYFNTRRKAAAELGISLDLPSIAVELSDRYLEVRESG